MGKVTGSNPVSPTLKINTNMKILSIETSCDETGVSVVEYSKTDNGYKYNVIADALFTQTSHEEYGGVMPTIAKREHRKSFPEMLKKALKTSNTYSETTNTEVIDEILNIFSADQESLVVFKDELSNIEKPDIDLIAVTNGPGLSPCLQIGVNFSKALSVLWDIPIVPINHMEGHLVAALTKEDTIKEPKYPLLTLLVSGGHTELILSNTKNSYEKIGSTLDDASGEAFDKVARLLDLGFPGGAKISALSKDGEDIYDFPRPMLHSQDYNFSFSGLKTAVLYKVNEIKEARSDNMLTDTDKKNISRSFEESVIDVLIKKTFKAIEEYGVMSIALGGGVSANQKLRDAFENLASTSGIDSYIPERSLSTDNSVMIALSAIYGEHSPKDVNKISVDSNLSL